MQLPLWHFDAEYMTASFLSLLTFDLLFLPLTYFWRPYMTTWVVVLRVISKRPQSFCAKRSGVAESTKGVIYPFYVRSAI